MEPDDQQTRDIIGAAIKVHKIWGPGFLEAVYHRSMEIELTLRGHDVRTEVPFALVYEGFALGPTYRADLICGAVLLELKCHSGLGDADLAQILHYLRASGLRRGLLLNFGLPRLQVRRVVNGWEPGSASDSAFSAAPLP